MHSRLTIETIESDTTNSNLERGRILYHKGHVQDIKIINQDFIIGKVKGHKTYKVFLEFKNNDFKAYCNCLYEPKGYCKHQVALKYTLKDILDSQQPANKKQIPKFFHQIIFNILRKNVYKLTHRF